MKLTQTFGPRHTTEVYVVKGPGRIRQLVNGASPEYYNVAGNSFEDISEVDDVNIEHFFTRRANGEVFNNPYYKNKSTFSFSNGVWEQKSPQYGTYTYDGDPANPGSRCKWQADALSIALNLETPQSVEENRQYAKLKAISGIDKSPYAFMEDIAELRKSIQLIRHPVESILTALRTKGSMAKVSNAWLLTRFGFGNLFYSTFNAYDMYIARLNKPSLPIRRTSRAFYGFDHSTGEQLIVPYGSGNQSTFLRNTSVEIRGRIGILYEVSNPIDTIQEYAGLRLKDVPTTYWQLMPQSWAIDRFIDISKSISALTNLADPKVKILAAWDSSTTKRNGILQHISQVAGGSWSVSQFTPSSYQKFGSEKTRTVWYPSVTDATPRVHIDMNVYRTADVVALLLSKLIKAKRTR